MRGFRAKIAILTGLVALVGQLAAQTSASGAPPRPSARPAHRRAKPSPKPSPVQEPDPPPRPLTPEEMPPTPPQVSYNNGLLSIVASNSTLADILRAVTARTGAAVDAAPNLLNARIAARIGPGTPRQVLSDLLRGPQLDYILVGAEGDPDGVRSIILTPSTTAPAGAQATAAVMARPTRGPAPPQEEMDEEVPPEEIAEPEPPGPQGQPGRQAPPFAAGPQGPGQVGPGQFGPQGPGQFGPQAVEPPPGEGGPQQPGQPQIKTPEQLLEELRKLQQGNPSTQPNRPER
jgi:hypothetical protein